MEILQYPDPRLNEISEPVTQFGEPLHKLLDMMKSKMREANGIGLAAPQMGVLRRAFVVDLTREEENGGYHELINPFIFGGRGEILFEEGCLSLPGLRLQIKRHRHVGINYQDRFGEARQMEASGLLAIAIQHENDHLEGLTMLDRVPFWKRYFIARKQAQGLSLSAS